MLLCSFSLCRYGRRSSDEGIFTPAEERIGRQMGLTFRLVRGFALLAVMDIIGSSYAKRRSELATENPAHETARLDCWSFDDARNLLRLGPGASRATAR